MSSLDLENFEIELGKGILRVPESRQETVLPELEDIAIRLAHGDDPIGDGTADVERFNQILDPENWVRLFTPTTVRNYRDIDGRPIPGDNYDAQMEAVFTRYLNPVALAFGRYVKEIPCELLRDGEWAEMYQILASWSKYQHYFLYTCDPLEPAKTMRGKPEVVNPTISDPTTLN